MESALTNIRFILIGLIAMLLAVAFATEQASGNTPIAVSPEKSIERIEASARYYFAGPGETPSFEEAFSAYKDGKYVDDFPSASGANAFTQELWVAVQIQAAQPSGAKPLRRVLGLGGIFVVLPKVYLVGESFPAQQILESEATTGGELVPRYLTYIRTKSFELRPGEVGLVLINMTLADRPTLGVFREGELGRNQIVATLIKAGFTFTLLIIGIVLAVIAIVTQRRIGLLIAVGYSLVMVQVDASLYTTTFASSPHVGRQIWEALTLSATFFLYYAFLYTFRDSLRISGRPLLIMLAIILPLPLIWVAVVSDVTTDIIWAYYLSLLLFSGVIALRFDIAPRLRLIAGAIMLASVIGAVLVEPFYLGRYLPDLTIEYLRDGLRLLAAMGILFMVLVDVRRTRQERDRMTEGRIEALRLQAESDRRLLKSEREYAKAREAASRRKRQLASASHDIRQPLVGLRQALAKESDSLAPRLQSRLGEAIDYLEQLTDEYSERAPQSVNSMDQGAESYSLGLILRAVDDMFRVEAEAAGITLEVEKTNVQTSMPALALIRATSNLVANALRHADASVVRIKIESTEPVRIIVEDNGCGIAKHDIERLQQPEEKGDASSGDGLGFAIINELAERHRFTLHITSEIDVGTRATICL